MIRTRRFGLPSQSKFHCAEAATFAKATGLTQCEDRRVVVALFLRSHLLARGDFSRDRFGGTEGLSASKWAADDGVPGF